MMNKNLVEQAALAARIRALIDAGGYKQGFIAQKAGYDPKRFSAMLVGRKIIETGDITPIALALGVTPNDLLGFQNAVSKKHPSR